MDIPAHIRLLSTLQSGIVYYYIEEEFGINIPHYFIVVNKNPKADEIIILGCATSKIDKRKNVHLKLGHPEETLVIIQPEEYPIFTEVTAIDCNNAFEKPVSALSNKLERSELQICSLIMSEHLVNKIINGMLMSNQISQEIKKKLSEK